MLARNSFKILFSGLVLVSTALVIQNIAEVDIEEKQALNKNFVELQDYKTSLIKAKIHPVQSIDSQLNMLKQKIS